MKKVIFHIDVNSAFLSWEATWRKKEGVEGQDLRDIPSAVGGDMSKRHGVILAKSTPAKQYNIRTGEPITDALKKCPELVIVPPNFEVYTKYSKAFIDILREYTPDIEQYSIDEAFMDMTGTERLFGKPLDVAGVIKNRIKNELGFTVNIGISDKKMLAKMASDFKKPERIHTLYLSEIEKKMWPLPVTDLFFVGKSTASTLEKLGIHTIGELAKTDVGILTANLKKHGEVIWRLANGIDSSPVETEAEANKGYGNSTTISFDVTDAGTAKMVLLGLTEKVAARMRDDGVSAETVSVTIKDFNLQKTSHQTVLGAPTNITDEIHSEVCRLFDELWDGTPIRLLGVSAGKLSRGGSSRQMSLFDDTDYEKLEAVDKAVDSIRNKYGVNAIKRAVFLEDRKVDGGKNGREQ